MINTLKDVISAVGVLTGGYTLALLGAEAVQDLTGKKITSQKQLTEIVKEESEKLGMGDDLVVGKFYDKGHKRYKKIRGTRSFEEDFDIGGKVYPAKIVEVKENFGDTRGTVRHELYHLKNHTPFRKNSVARFLRGFFYEEPTATLYALTGIRL